MYNKYIIASELDLYINCLRRDNGPVLPPLGVDREMPQPPFGGGEAESPSDNVAWADPYTGIPFSST